jgi:hypothetical protein
MAMPKRVSDALTKRVHVEEPPRDRAVNPVPGESALLTTQRLLRTMNRIIERMSARADLGEGPCQLQDALWALQRLMVFINPPGSQRPSKELKAGALELYKRGLFSALEAKKAYFKAKGKSRGEQPMYRFVTAKVLEAKEDAKRNGRPVTWLELARMFCPCGKVGHYESCAERLRRNVKHLNKLLRMINRFCDDFDRLPA